MLQGKGISRRSLPNILGGAVSLAVIGFVGYRLWTLGAAALGSALELHAALVAALSFAYAGLLFLVGAAWSVLIWGGSPRPAPSALDNFGAFAFTQISKYLPGNIFHLVGRYAVMLRLGAGHPAIAWGTAAELVLASLAAFLIVVVASPRYMGQFLPNVSALWVGAAAVIFVIFMAATWRFLRSRIREKLSLLDRRRAAGSALIALLLYGVFFCAAGGLMMPILRALVPAQALDVWAVIPLVAGAWTLGFLTPGAPAGIGVRDAALILALTPSVGAEAAAVGAVAYRIMTTVGDIVLFAVGAMWAFHARRRLIVHATADP